MSFVVSAATAARRSCPYSSGRPEIVAVKAGTLDDRSDVQPVVKLWCDDKQPWVDLVDVHAIAQE